MKPVLFAVAVLAAAPALAQNKPAFQGPFVGAQAGWQSDTLDASGFVDDTFGSGSRDSSGFAYGGQAGFDFRFSQWVLGGELGITGRTGDLRANDESDTRLSFGRTINVSARAGYVITEQGMVYARGGYSNAEYTGREFDSESSSGTRDGFLVGGGFEWMFTDHISTRIEYNYSDYGSVRGFGFVGDSQVEGKVNFSRHNVMAGINYRF